MTNKESLFASLHILMRAIPDGPADAGHRLHRYWYRESRCQVRTGWQILCALCGYKSVKIYVNPWLMNYLPAFGIFTTVERALQIRPFMQNKANFRKSQMNVNNVLTTDYEKRTLGKCGKNKANSNPIKANSNPIKANIMPKQTQYKPNQTQSLLKDLIALVNAWMFISKTAKNSCARLWPLLQCFSENFDKPGVRKAGCSTRPKLRTDPMNLNRLIPAKGGRCE